VPEPGSVCLACGEPCASDAPARECPKCGQRLVRRSSILRTGIGRADLDDGAGDALPPEVEAASADPQNRFDQYIMPRRSRGRGAASVHRAWDVEQRRFVALKVLKTAYREHTARSLREAHAVTQLSHPNIVKVHKAGLSAAGASSRWSSSPAARSTGSWSRRPPPVRELVALFRTVCDAVRHAHSRGIVHRDLKPQNILVDAEGHPYVVDFGIARPTEPGWTVTLADQAIGTPSFMAPEQVRGGAPSAEPAVDVYALGAVLYYVLTGRPPFDAGPPTRSWSGWSATCPSPPGRSIRRSRATSRRSA